MPISETNRDDPSINFAYAEQARLGFAMLGNILRFLLGVPDKAAEASVHRDSRLLNIWLIVNIISHI